MGKKVCHLTSVHSSYDVRIFVKECTTLSSAGYEVYLVAKGNSRCCDNIHVVGIGSAPKNRLFRMFFFSHCIYKKAISLNCDIYHIHDPELLPYGKKLKKDGKTVFFDCHEDIPAQILDKHWIPLLLRNPISELFGNYQKRVLKSFDGIIAATPHICETLKKCSDRITVINNYPRLDDISFSNASFIQRERIICYAGSLDVNRGRELIIEAMKQIDGLLFLASDEKIEGQNNIKNCGVLDRAGINKLYSHSRLGLVIYQPLANHLEAQPIKMFEYMAAGVPVVASNFPLWKQIIETANCGICVNPRNVDEIVKACNYLLDNPEEGEKLGNNGRLIVEQQYNWRKEGEKLLLFYKNSCERIN